MALPSTIAIDGTAASGKSTIGRELAGQLGYLYFDTGAMYRAVTWIALERGLDIDDEQAVTEIARSVVIDITEPTVDDGRPYTVMADSADITWQIRQAEVDANVSQVAAYPQVRAALIEQQMRVGERGKVVMVGRDIGTVVLPQAEIKIYFDAAVEVRAERRWQEAQARGDSNDYQQILEAMRRRDQIDSQRAVAPMRPADDAIIIDTGELSVEEVKARVQAILEQSTTGEKS